MQSGHWQPSAEVAESPSAPCAWVSGCPVPAFLSHSALHSTGSLLGLDGLGCWPVPKGRHCHTVVQRGSTRLPGPACCMEHVISSVQQNPSQETPRGPELTHLVQKPLLQTSVAPGSWLALSHTHREWWTPVFLPLCRKRPTSHPYPSLLVGHFQKRTKKSPTRRLEEERGFPFLPFPFCRRPLSALDACKFFNPKRKSCKKMGHMMLGLHLIGRLQAASLEPCFTARAGGHGVPGTRLRPELTQERPPQREAPGGGTQGGLREAISVGPHDGVHGFEELSESSC